MFKTKLEKGLRQSFIYTNENTFRFAVSINGQYLCGFATVRPYSTLFGVENKRLI